MIRQSERLGGGWRLVLLAGLLAATGLAPARAAGRRAEDLLARQLVRAGGSLAWRVPLTLKFTTSVRSSYLVNEYLYVMTTDGTVSAIRADTGKRIWTRQLAEPGRALWPPAVCQSADCDAVAFTRTDDVLLLAPATGLEAERTERDEKGEARSRRMRPVRLRSLSLAAASASGEHVFVIAPGHRVRRYDIVDSYESWQADMPTLLRLAPVYLPKRDLLLVADIGGLVAGLSASDRTRKFARQLEGEPIGWLATDRELAYVATSAPRLHALELEAGEVRGEYPLPGLPTGGPIVTETSIYQATSAGVLRIGRAPEDQGWLAPDTKRFLAEWPRQVVLLGNQGKVIFVGRQSGRVQAVVDPGGKCDGVSNVRNDAVILVSPRGEVRCLRPLGGKTLTSADFHAPSAPGPEAAEVAGEPAEAEAEPAAGTEEASREAATEKEAAEKTGPQMTLEERLLADPLRSRR